MALRSRLAAAALLATAQDPCLALGEVVERTACYAAEDAPAGDSGEELEAPGWRVGEEMDPITDEKSVIVRRRAEAPHRDGRGALALRSAAATQDALPATTPSSARTRVLARLATTHPGAMGRLQGIPLGGLLNQRSGKGPSLHSEAVNLPH